MKAPRSILLTIVPLVGFIGVTDAQTSTQYSLAVSNDRPVLYWSFDGGSGNAIQRMPLHWMAVSNQNDLVPSTASIDMRVSHASLGDGLNLTNAASFDGTSFFGASGLAFGSLTLRGPYAIEMWFKVNGAPFAGEYLLSLGNTAIIYNYNDTFLELYAGAGGRTALGGPSVADDAWHHVLFVYYGNGSDGVADRVDAYLDGAVSSIPGAGITAPLSLQSGAYVGAANAAGESPFTGDIDEVAIYDLSGLTSEAGVTAAVATLATRHLAAATSGESYASQVLADHPFLYWNFDETSGNALQQAPMAPAQNYNRQNDLTPVGSAGYASHAEFGSGLLLGDAVDLSGNGSFQSLGGLVSGLPGNLTGPWALEVWFQMGAAQTDRYLVNLGVNRPAVIYGYLGQRLEVFGNGRSGNNGITMTDANWHRLLVVNYNTAPASANPGANANRVDFFIDGVQHTNVGGGFNTPVNFSPGLILGAATTDNSSGFYGRLDELAIYDLGAYTNVADIEADMSGMDARHYAAAFGAASVGIITVTQQPGDAIGQLGQTVTFTAAATVTGTGSPLLYQWQRNGVSIQNATNTTFTTPALSLYDIGTNSYRVRISAGPAFKFSESALLTVATPPPAPPTFYEQAVARDNPLLYWNFDEMAGAALQQAAVSNKAVTTENDLVPVGAGLYRARHADLQDGLDRLGSAVELNGSSYLIANTPWVGKTQLSGPWAMELWLQTYGATEAYIANFGYSGADNAPALIYGFMPDQLELFNGGYRTGTNGPVVPDANWHHLLCVNYDDAPAGASNRVDIYFDGVLFSNVGDGFNQPVSLARVLLGASTTTPDNGFTGALDEFALYDWSGMSADQIATKAQYLATNHYAAAHATDGPSYAATVLAAQPVLYYCFDEAEGPALQLAPVTLPPVVASRNDLLAINGAGRIQHSALNDGVYLGNALEFNGSGYYQAAQLSAGRPALQPPWALEFWMQPDGQPNGAYLMNFGNDAAGHGFPSVIYNFGAPGELNLFVSPGNATASGAVVTDTNWHHVVWVDYGDGAVGVANRVDVYLDNVCYSNVQNTFNSSLDLSHGLLLGASSPDNDLFKGRLDEIAIYDLSSLTSEDAITTRVQRLVSERMAAALNPSPALNISLAAAQLTLTWQGAGYIVQTNGNLADPMGWADVTGATVSPVVVSPLPVATTFFRLKKQ